MAAEYYHYDPVNASTPQPTSQPPLSAFDRPPQPPQPPQPPISPHHPMADSLASSPAVAAPVKPKPTRRSRKAAVKSDSHAFSHTAAAAASINNNPGGASPPLASATAPRSVQIKTKFPVARIKRIMQADEDVGKVAQVTPVVVSKALELFMIALCDKASEQARQRNSKRITAGHLKQAILHEEQFDFLADIIEKIPDIPLPSEGSSLTNGGDNSEDGATSAKKARKPRQRKAKDEDAV